MKKLCKRCLTFLIALVVAILPVIPAVADDASVTWNGQEKGFSFSSGDAYTDSDLFSSFKRIMPGDIRTENIIFRNNAEDSDFVKLYLRAQIHDETANPLSSSVVESGETVASMKEFLSKLSMKVWQGEKLIYEASPDQTDGLDENVYLGTIRSGDTTALRGELSVPIDLDNRFADRIGEVDWIFSVEAFNESQLTVRKIWSDGYEKHKNDSITVNLMKDGKLDQTQLLSDDNGWAFTFDRLEEGHKWMVEEAEVPADYKVSYAVDGTTTTIINTCSEEPTVPGEPLSLTVHKVWAEKYKNCPESVNVTLYDGSKAVETVQLSAKNNWTYTWKDPNRYGDWQILETSIPKGYTPSYNVKDGVITITNTATLIQTGQLNWPILILVVLGILCIAAGFVILSRKRDHSHAE